ncbi:hypothetical protein M404DRAFT_478516 [Pisolithus tinctorius Marx 270]|uniref:Uncharacterized protein n=1 Tax=Pisolithus tinctorius Marx 270 TaxID=870435 RepID=A0A0C3PER7_PISTI|nr:hypothetical protein M404DRAFT_478516 [Pisolithus tinctorius Marx 270]
MKGAEHVVVVTSWWKKRNSGTEGKWRQVEKAHLRPRNDRQSELKMERKTGASLAVMLEESD